MTIQEAVRDLNSIFKTEKEQDLTAKINKLEEDINILNQLLGSAFKRIEFLENELGKIQTY
ncbi:MAG: hypothetical protein J6W16_01490 [Methanobrevibacter sp.]|nr:hypothetical protein [Methanobrevibacter sp.]